MRSTNGGWWKEEMMGDLTPVNHMRPLPVVGDCCVAVRPFEAQSDYIILFGLVILKCHATIPVTECSRAPTSSKHAEDFLS